ncbi:MAG: hypothetical protein HFJ19_05390 [Clostridia bacterium]|nr:hypothetical protein [Clostridia bacterium]
MNKNKTYVVGAGAFFPPKEGQHMEMPPENTLRRELEEGEHLAILQDVSANELAMVETALRNGITDIPAGKLQDRDAGR